MTIIDVLALIALSILAAAMVIWYYYWRRKMLWLMHDVAIALEKELKPIDKNYLIVGYLVGFKAEFKLDSMGRREAYAMLLLLPRHSLLYYPVARFFTSKIDRLDILLRDTQVKPRRCHIVSEKWLKLLKRDSLSVKGLREETVRCQGKKYRVYYEREKDRDLLVEILNIRKGRYIRISSIPEKNAVIMTMKAEPDKIGEAIRDLSRILKDLGK